MKKSDGQLQSVHLRCVGDFDPRSSMFRNILIIHEFVILLMLIITWKIQF